MSVLSSDTEIVTVQCSTCPNSFTYVLSDEEDRMEAHFGALDNRDWEERDGKIYCDLCAVDAPLSYYEEADARVDAEARF